MKETRPKELSYITWKWLKTLGLRIDKSFVEREITTHPDYPAIVSVADFLDSYDFSYQAVTADRENFNEMQYPLLAHVKEPDGNAYLTIVSKTEEWYRHTDLLLNWSGIVLFPEKKENWKNIVNNINYDQYRESIVLLLFIVLTSYSTYRMPVLNYAIFCLLSLGGIVISWLTFKTELGYQNQIVKQVCNSLGSAGSCDNVMKSPQAKGIWNITPSVAGLGWFVTQWVLLMLAAYLSNFDIFYSVYFVSLIGIAVSGWSIYIQKIVLRQWCALCMGIVAVLILQAAISFSGLFAQLNTITIFQSSLAIYLFVFMVIVLLVIQPIKKMLESCNQNKRLSIELRRWKTDTKVFTGLLEQNAEADCTTWEDEILIGNLSASIKILIICNPYCGPCAKAHRKLDALIDRYPDDINMSVRFAVHSNSDNPATNAVRMLLQAHKQKRFNDKDILNDWFDRMIEEKIWIEKYICEDKFENDELLLKHEQWSNAVNISFTPTIFINGRQMPKQYTVDELIILLPELLSITKRTYTQIK
ncbi:vitamin K epoxide reductase family protein [Terrimonas rubra]|uniref:Vitamin K epoxide reductase family protein n=1 Tax=Terrimonas rubra TaxID=1035890 RepID=A0ABW6A5R3_9BACT